MRGGPRRGERGELPESVFFGILFGNMAFLLAILEKLAKRKHRSLHFFDL